MRAGFLHIPSLFMLVVLMTILAAQNVQPVSAEPAGIGEWVSDSRISLCVHSFSSAQSISYYPYTPDTAEYVFAWVDVSLKNVGGEEVSTNSLYAFLRDADDYIYERIIVPSPKQWQLIDLPPGETVRGEIYFEVPAQAVITKFQWIDYQSFISIIIPEFPSFLILPLFMTLTLLTVIICKRRHTRKSCSTSL